jgi:hypothetical protein
VTRYGKGVDTTYTTHLCEARYPAELRETASTLLGEVLGRANLRPLK